MSQKTLTRADLSEAIHTQTDLSRRESATLLDEILAEMTQELVRGNALKISSFATFTVRQKNPRMGRNPRTGQEALISSRRVVSFRPSAQLHHRLQRKKPIE